MGLEEVKKGLKKEIDSSCASIIKEAEIEKKKLIDSASQEVEGYKGNEELKAESLMKMIEKREFASANISAKKHMLNVKKEMIDSVFGEVLKNLNHMPDTERKKIISNLLKHASKQIEVSTVYCSTKDKKFISGYTVKIDDTVEGIICETQDASQRVDYTYQSILLGIKEENLKEVAAILF
jgi:V/A-type H+-transporting ATPase subunit E